MGLRFETSLQTPVDLEYNYALYSLSGQAGLHTMGHPGQPFSLPLANLRNRIRVLEISPLETEVCRRYLANKLSERYPLTQYVSDHDTQTLKVYSFNGTYTCPLGRPPSRKIEPS